MQAVTLNVLDLLPCLIWEPLVKSHSNETQVWKRCRDLGETMLRAAVHIFTVNELMLQMLWRRNRGCLRQEFPCCVFKPSEEEVLCVNNSTWRWGRAVHLVCAHQAGLLWSAVSTPGRKRCVAFCKWTCSRVTLWAWRGFFISFAPCKHGELSAVCIGRPQSPLQLPACCGVIHGCCLCQFVATVGRCVPEPVLLRATVRTASLQRINCIKEELALSRWVLRARIKTAMKTAWETE